MGLASVPFRSLAGRILPGSGILGHNHKDDRKVDIRLRGEGNSKLPWRKAGQPSHLVDVVDSDQ